MKIRNPATDQWIVIGSGPATFKHLHVFVADTVSGANIALAVRDTDIPVLLKPASGSVVPTGATGATAYEYFVTAFNADGETEPLVLSVISNGNATLDETNYHTISWDASAGATGYNVYVLSAGVWRKIVVASGTTTINDGSWVLSPVAPWLNMSQVVMLLDFERLNASSIFQMDSNVALAENEQLVFATTNSLVNLYGRVE